VSASPLSRSSHVSALQRDHPRRSRAAVAPPDNAWVCAASCRSAPLPRRVVAPGRDPLLPLSKLWFKDRWRNVGDPLCATTFSPRQRPQKNPTPLPPPPHRSSTTGACQNHVIMPPPPLLSMIATTVHSFLPLSASARLSPLCQSSLALIKHRFHAPICRVNV
jgi:hypothetical protein